MPRQQKNFRLPELTRTELDRLCKAFGMTESEVVILAIDTLFHRQIPETVSSVGLDANQELVKLIVNGEATLDPGYSATAD